MLKRFFLMGKYLVSALVLNAQINAMRGANEATHIPAMPYNPKCFRDARDQAHLLEQAMNKDL